VITAFNNVVPLATVVTTPVWLPIVAVPVVPDVNVKSTTGGMNGASPLFLIAYIVNV